MAPDKATSTSMYCRTCGCELAGLSENRCPKCRRPFDPNNKQTHFSFPPRIRLRNWGRRLGRLALGLLLVGGVILGWLDWQWCMEHRSLLAIQAIVEEQRE